MQREERIVNESKHPSGRRGEARLTCSHRSAKSRLSARTRTCTDQGGWIEACGNRNKEYPHAQATPERFVVPCPCEPQSQCFSSLAAVPSSARNEPFAPLDERVVLVSEPRVLG